MIDKFVSCFVSISLIISLFISPFPVLADEDEDDDDEEDNKNYSKQVIFTELMVDPEKVNDSRGEWIEVLNNSETEISLNGWVINDGQNHAISGAYNIKPNAYAVICRNENPLENAGVKCDYSAKMVLSNKEETVVLKDKEGNNIDKVKYEEEDVKKGKTIKVANDAAQTLSLETIFTYGLGDFGTPAKNPTIGTRSFPTIQGALNASLDKDTINVPRGEYYENLSIQKEVKLIGEGIGKTIVFSNNCSNAVVAIDRDNVAIGNFSFDDNKCNYQVLRIDKGTGVVVEENEIKNGDTGIIVYSAAENKAAKNLITGNKTGIQNNDLANVFDARFNFWGHQLGPFHESLNPTAQGSTISNNVVFRPFYTDSQKTALSKYTISEKEFNPNTFLSNGVFSLPEGITDEKDTVSVIVNEQMTINIAMLDGSHSVNLPSGIVISRKGGGAIDATKLSADNIEISSLSGFASDTAVEGALQWGIPDVGLVFSEPITLNIFVGTSKNGQTLSILRSSSTDSDWTADGIVSPATCSVSEGLCTFQATKASYFAATVIVSTPTSTPAPTSTPTPTPSSNSSSTSNSGSSSSTSGAKVSGCHDGKPGSISTLLSALPQANSVTLNWSRASDPFSHYLLAYGRAPGVFEYGNPNIGGKDSTSYTVYNLSDRTRYYFKVLAVNNCNPGDFSNELSGEPFTVTKSLAADFSVPDTLGAKSDQEIVRESDQTEPNKNQPQAYVTSSRNIFTPILNFFNTIVKFFGRLFG